MAQIREQSENALINAAMDHMVGFDASGVPQTLFSRIFAGILVLRWVDLAEAEQEAMAIFEERPYEPLLPSPLQWRHWAQLTDPLEMSDRILEIGLFVERRRVASTNPLSAWVHLVAEPLVGTLDQASEILCHFVHWVAELPFETIAERRRLLSVFDDVVRLTRNASNEQFATPTDIANLVVALGKPMPGERVYDPCFGYGNLLVAAWQCAERGVGEMRLSGPLLDITGIDTNREAFLIGLTRMLLAGIEDPHLEIGNSLERESPNSPSRQGFDLILANPPFGSKSSESPWLNRLYAIPTRDSIGLFIQHALMQLKPNGRAVIVVPEGFLFRGGSERELRRRLIEQGQIEAVIGLPAGAFQPFTSVKCSLLLLNRRGGNSSVRMADATSQFEPVSGRKAPSLRSASAEQFVGEVLRPELRKASGLAATLGGSMFTTAASMALGPIGTALGLAVTASKLGSRSQSIWEVNTAELAAADWDLSARRREKGGLDDLLSSLTESLGKSTELASLSDVVKISAGRAIKSSDLLREVPNEHPVGYIRIGDVSQGKVERVSSWLEPGIAEVEKRWALLPGDVLLSKSGTIGKIALVRNGAVGSVASSGFYVLRVEQGRLDAGFLLGYLNSPVCQNWLAAQSHGVVIQHLNRPILDRLPVPLVPISLQRRAALQFQEDGTDVLSFLTQALGAADEDPISLWVANVLRQLPATVEAVYDPLMLSPIEMVAESVRDIRNKVAHDLVRSPLAPWILSFAEGLRSFQKLSQVPKGPSLLNLIQEGVRSLNSSQLLIQGFLPVETQARSLNDLLARWLELAAAALLGEVNIAFTPNTSLLSMGKPIELLLSIENRGSLPLRNLTILTSQDWGQQRFDFLGEHHTARLTLRGESPKVAGLFSILVLWSTQTLDGRIVKGERQLSFTVVADYAQTTPVKDLGGNPYITGTPVFPERNDVFFGRSPLLEQISRQIVVSGNVVLLEGNRRSGKTSILSHLEGIESIPGWLGVYCSLQNAEGSSAGAGVPTAEVFRGIAAALGSALIRLRLDTPLPNGKIILADEPIIGVGRACREGISEASPFTDLREYLDIVLEILRPRKLGIVLMLDEFDKLQDGIDNGITSPQVPENIRFLIQRYPRFSAILTGSRRLKRLREEYWSALFGLGKCISVSTLDPSEARRLVVEPVQGRLTYSPEAVDRVVSVTACQPFLLQCLCNQIFDFAAQTSARSVTLDVVDQACSTLAKNNEHFATLWNYAGSPRRRLIMMLCSQRAGTTEQVSFGELRELLTQWGIELTNDELEADLSYLRELEVVDLVGKESDKYYQLAIPLMSAWIDAQQDFQIILSQAQAQSEDRND